MIVNHFSDERKRRFDEAPDMFNLWMQYRTYTKSELRDKPKMLQHFNTNENKKKSEIKSKTSG